jgi:hypothetical protein
MKHILSSLFLLVIASSFHAQVADFEQFNLPLDTFDNGSIEENGFQVDVLFFQNSYDTSFGGIWDGFALSTMRNDSTEGYMNQYSAITGSGNESNTYMVAYPPFSGSLSIAPDILIDGQLVWNSVYVTNSTYAYLSMLNGDGFAKKFGGASGNDPDYFMLDIILTINAVAMDTISVSLADYRFNQNNDDFILDTWLEVDLTEFDTAIHDTSSLQFVLRSSDTAFGFINTPTYFCIDDVSYSYLTGLDDLEDNYEAHFKNLGEAILITTSVASTVEFYSIGGSLLRTEKVNAGETVIPFDNRTRGFSIIVLKNVKESASAKIFFQ